MENKGEEGDDMWRVPGILLLMVGAIVVRQFRGLHVAKVMELAESIQAMGWLQSSLVSVQICEGGYRLVDGMHRVSALLYLIKIGKWPKTKQIQCVVFKESTPSSYILRYAGLVNTGNDAVS